MAHGAADSIAGHGAGVTFVSAEEAMRRVPVADAVRIIEAAFRSYGEGGAGLSRPSAMSLSHPGIPGAYKIKGAVLASEGVVGFRMIADVDGAGSDWHYVADAATGELKGLVDETRLHWRRTAVTGAVAARWLAPEGARTLAVVGAGNIADELPAALAHLFDIGELRVATRRFERAQDFAARHGAATGVRMRAFDTVAGAVDGADVVLTITSAPQPVVEADMLRDGATLVALGGDYELGRSVLDWADLFIVDDIEFACMVGSVSGWLRDGSADRASVEARMAGTIGDVGQGRVGRSGPGQNVLAVIQGMATGDLALAHVALGGSAAQG